MPTDEGRKAARLAVIREISRRQEDATRLATRAGIHPQTVSALISGSRWPAMRTLGALDAALGWPAGTLSSIGEGEPAPDEENVSAATEDEHTFLYRRPDGLRDAEWEQMKASAMEYLTWQADKARG